MTTTVAVTLNYLSAAALEFSRKNLPEMFLEELFQEERKIIGELADHLGLTPEELAKVSLEGDMEILWVRISPEIEKELKEFAESLVPFLGDAFTWAPEKAFPPLIPPEG